MKKSMILTLILVNSFLGFSKDPFTMKAFGKGVDQYWIIIPETTEALKQSIVVFLHGNGASNPACYGGWIDEIITTNHVVIFPKFQAGTSVPQTKKFERRVDASIRLSVAYLQTTYRLNVTDLMFVSHSIGGIISANLADMYGKTSTYNVSGLLLVQPGFKYVGLGSQKTYAHINPNARIVCITGNNDIVAGKNFTRLILSTTSQIPRERKLWLNQFEYRLGKNKIGYGHVEPISVDKKFDSGNRNPVISSSFILGKTDEVDRNCYWRLTDLLLVESIGIDYTFDKNSADLVAMGFWGKAPIRALEVEY